MQLRALVVAATASAALVATSSEALAHEGNPDYRSEVSGIVPAAPGVEVQMLNFDDSLELSNSGAETVVVEGYEGEPYIRISADGTVDVNTRSPAYYLNDDRFADAEVPPSADPDAEPVWEQVDRSGQYTWHDHRAHYMGTGIPHQVSDRGIRTKVFDYEVPIDVGGKPAVIEGTLYWAGEDEGLPLLPFLGLAGFGLTCAVGVFVMRRRGRPANEAAGDGPGEGEEAW